MRRSKRTRDAQDEGSADADAQDHGPSDEAGASDDGDAVEEIEARLAPIEEFRSKSDSWMKETSAQLARIATHVQQDEKRQGKLDERLAEFEERLQAMLQLTEAVSMDQNPFVAGRDTGAAPAGAAGGPATSHDDAPPRRSAVRGAPGPDENVLVIPTDGEGYVGKPAPRVQAHPNDAAAERDAPAAPADEDERADLDRGVDEDALLVAAEGPLEDPADNPFYTGPSTLRPADPDATDANRQIQATRRPAAPTGNDEPPTSARPLEDAEGEQIELDMSAARDAERRLAFLQVAGLLARHLRPMEIDAFLDTYAQTGWIEHRDITKIRTLATDLSRNRRDPVQRIDREELHMRTILLMSRIAPSLERRAPRQLDRLFQDSRRIATSEWMSEGS